MKSASLNRILPPQVVTAEPGAAAPRVKPLIYAQQIRHGLAFHFALAVLAHLLVWTLLPLMFQSNIALDMAEGLAWGKEWQLGYEKDPPLYPWVIHALTTLSGKQLWISYLAGQVCVATVFFSVWQLGKRIASEKEALVGALLLEGIYYFSLPTLEFNDILLQMPFAALFGWLLHKAITDNRLHDWVLTGLVASLGLWSRYSMGAIIAPLALFALLHPLSRQRLRAPGPWVMMAVATLLFVPHLIWIGQTDFMSIKYVGNRAPKSPDLLAYLQGLFSFVSAQLGALLPMLLVSVLLWRWRSSRDWLQRRWAQFDFAYLTVLALGPICFSLFLSWVAMRPLRHMWGAPLWSFIGLFIVLLLKPVLTVQRLRQLARVWWILFLLPIIFFVLQRTYGTAVTGNEQNVNFPGQQLGAEINTRWRNSTGTPLHYVVGDTWSAGNVAFYAEDRPSVIFAHGGLQISPWIDPADVHRTGAVVLWDVKEEGETMPPRLRERFPKAVFQHFLMVEGQRLHQFGVAFLYPSNQQPVTQPEPSTGAEI